MTARRLLIGAAALALASGGPAGAATVAISLTLPAVAQITGLSDVTFTNVAVTSDAVNAQNVCTYSSSLTRSYTVTASGSGTGSAFQLSNGSGSSVPYAVGWAGTSGATATTALTAGTASGTFGGGALLPACTAGSTTSTLKITIVASDLQTMVGGTSYTGTLTLLISPV